MHRRGKTIIFSTHQMEMVEELCEDIAIISKGELLVNGPLRQVKRSSGRLLVRLALVHNPAIAWLDAIPGIRVLQRRQDYVEMEIFEPARAEIILKEALSRGEEVAHYEIVEPSLNEIFIEYYFYLAFRQGLPGRGLIVRPETNPQANC